MDSCVTQREKLQLEFKWTIKEFLELPQSTGEYLKSTVFPSTEDEPVYWRLKIYPRGDSIESKEYVSLFLKVHSSNLTKVHTKFTIEIEDIYGNLVVETELAFHTYSETFPSWGWPKFIKRDSLKDQLKESKSDTLIMKCSMTIFLNFCTTSGPSPLQPMITVENTHSSKDLKCLLSDGSYSDFIINIDNRKFEVHKCILYARSSVFAAMLRSNMAESTSSEVTLSDVDPDVFEKVLQFIYTGQLAMMPADALDILPLADKYDIDTLKQQCANVLVTEMHGGNAVKTMIMADAYQLVDLKQMAIEFVLKNTEVVSQTDDWNLLVEKYPHLTTELLLTAKTFYEKDLMFENQVADLFE